MARTLSDTLIIAVIEAATRLTGARGPIAGSAAAQAAQGGAAATPPAGEAGAAGGTGATSTATAPASSSGSGDGASSGGDHDSRSAEQIAADFRTIYTQIEELVKSSAEQETKAVGFGPVSR